MLDKDQFDEMDKDGDGKIDTQELYTYEQSKTVGDLLAEIVRDKLHDAFGEEKGRKPDDFLDLNLRDEFFMDIVNGAVRVESEGNEGMGERQVSTTGV